MFFLLGIALYASVPSVGATGSVALFVVVFLVIISIYGGGFATIPAYLKDMFGTRYVGAIHGLLITAWSVAGVAGPVLVNYIRQYEVDHGLPEAQAYNFTMYLLSNLLVTAVHERHHMSSEPPQPPQGHQRTRTPHPSDPADPRLAAGRYPLALGGADDAEECPEAVPVSSSGRPRGRPVC